MILTKKELSNLKGNSMVWKKIYLSQLTQFSKNINFEKKLCNAKLRSIITNGGIEL